MGSDFMSTEFDYYAIGGSRPWANSGAMRADYVAQKQRTPQEEIDRCLNCERPKCRNCINYEGAAEIPPAAREMKKRGSNGE